MAVEVALCEFCFHPFGPDLSSSCQFIGHGLLKMAWRRSPDGKYELA